MKYRRGIPTKIRNRKSTKARTKTPKPRKGQRKPSDEELTLNDLLRASISLQKGLPAVFEHMPTRDTDLVLYHWHKGTKCFSENDFSGAIEEFHVLSATDEVRDDSTLKCLCDFFCGVCELQMMAPKRAMAIFDKLQIVGLRGLISSCRGLAFLHMGQYEEALNECAKAEKFAERDKKPGNAFSGLPYSDTQKKLPAVNLIAGCAHLALGNHENARAKFIAVARESVTEQSLLVLTATQGLIHLGDYREALISARRFEKRMPDGHFHLFIRGLVKLDLNDPTALVELNEAIQRNPRATDVLTQRIQTLAYMTRDNAAAMNTLNKWAKLFPRDASVYLMRAELCYELDDLLGCITDLTKAVELVPNSPTPFFTLAVAYAAMGSQNDAEKNLQRALALDEGWLVADYSRGLVDLNLGRADFGVSSLEKAVAKLPEDGKRRYYLGLAYKRAGRPREALESLSKAGQLGFARAYEIIRELKAANTDWKIGVVTGKVPWNSTLKEAAREILAGYAADEQQPSSLRRFANLKDASDQFFESHAFPKKPNLTKKGLYESVAKAKH